MGTSWSWRRRGSGRCTKTEEDVARPKLPPVSLEMQRWCALLEDEVSGWRQVHTKPMFGMVALYRGDRIFAALPRTRAAESANSLLIKLPGVRGDRLSAASGPGKAWVSFEMESSDDISEVLRLLQRAYKKAGPP
jgi:hypothetical protein